MKHTKRFLIIMMLLAVLAGCSAGRKDTQSPAADSPPGQTEGETQTVEEAQTEEPSEIAGVSAAGTTETEQEAPSDSTKEKKKKASTGVSAPGEKGNSQQTEDPSEAPKPTSGKEEEPKPSGTPAKESGSAPATKPQAETQETPVSKPEEHTHSYRETVVSPTCETGGFTRHECACGEAWQDAPTQPLGHDYVQTGHADATEASEGYTEYTCSRCGAVRRETIPRIEPVGASASDAQQVCDEVNGYIRSHYAVTGNRGTYMGVTWVQAPSDVRGAVSSAIGTVDLYAQYYGAKSFYCGYLDDGGGSYTIVLYWDTI